MRNRNLLLTALIGTLLLSCGEPDPGRSRLQLDSTPASEVWLNGESAGETPLDLRLAPGQYEVVFKLPGFADHVNSVPLPANSEVELSVPLVAVDLDSDASEDLLFRLKKVVADLDAFFADLGQQPPGALAEVVEIADSGRIPTKRSERERLDNLLGGLAETIISLGTDDGLAERVRMLIDQLEW